MLKNTRILHRIALSALLPLVTLAALALYEISIKWTAHSEMARMQPIAEGVGELSRLVHELQRERGLSAAFMGSKGTQMRAGLVEQRKLTDAQRAASLRVLDYLKHEGGDPPHKPAWTLFPIWIGGAARSTIRPYLLRRRSTI